MTVVVNANTRDNRVELLGVSLTVAEALQLKSSIEWACTAVMNSGATGDTGNE